MRNILLIDVVNRYKPQPTSRTDLFLNVRNERIPLIKPRENISTVNAKLILIINGCKDKLRIGRI